MKKRSWFQDNWLALLTGLVAGAAALLLARLGNPGNMGFCIACFERDIAGALGLHSAEAVQYFRPEIVGIVLGALLAALCFREFRGKGGSSPLLRLILGMLVMIGALVFLGCPLRMVIRIGGGDLNALVGLAGFIVGILVGVVFLKKGFTLGRAYGQSKAEGAAFPALLTLAFLLSVTGLVGLFRSSESGPGSKRALWYVALLAGMAVGFLAQRSRFCMAGGIRNAVMFRDFGLVAAFGMVILTVLVGNLLLGQFGGFAFEGQPVAHSDGLWNFLGMTVVGWGSVLLGGCPLRQLILAGEGNTDSAVTVVGMLLGAALSHNFKLASSADGSAPGGHTAVWAALVILLLISLVCTFAKKKEGTK
jgi:YeeE/YedE family (DUF395).